MPLSFSSPCVVSPLSSLSFVFNSSQTEPKCIKGAQERDKEEIQESETPQKIEEKEKEQKQEKEEQW